ncbi:MAG: 16S rRNA (guanine(527)-N(7))-methyltransferase RsmG [Alphaproteobacteria bacterium]|nr:MAG: 16S rRNA (guanine(527)-N(7))-methyltransferase RsmG [Alphaproteobacteria bacterium]
MLPLFDEKAFFEKANVPRETKENICIYASLLQKWQKKLNLVGETTLPNMWARHFYDSFQLKELFDCRKAENLRILDIGSGAGFPGLLLSMLGLGEFHMVESNGKKCTFMRQVIRETGCNAVVHNERVEMMTPFPVDYIVSRACAPLDRLFDLGLNFIQPKTVCLFLKGQNADKEIEEARANWCFKIEQHTSAAQESGVILRVSHIKALR